MSLIIFVIAFAIVSCMIIWLANHILTGKQSPDYITLYIRGTAGTSTDLLESKGMLEIKHESLKKNSKF